MTKHILNSHTKTQYFLKNEQRILTVCYFHIEAGGEMTAWEENILMREQRHYFKRTWSPSSGESGNSVFGEFIFWEISENFSRPLKICFEWKLFWCNNASCEMIDADHWLKITPIKLGKKTLFFSDLSRRRCLTGPTLRNHPGTHSNQVCKI